MTPTSRTASPKASHSATCRRVAFALILGASSLASCSLRAQSGGGAAADPAAASGGSTEAQVQAGAERIHRELARVGASVAQAFGSARREVGRAHLSFQGASSLRTLVIPRPDATEDQLAETREQLTIMSRILVKAADPESTGRGAFRFHLAGLDFNAGTDLDAMALDGYGALFQVSVDFPLIEIAKAAEKKAPAPADKDATWERTRRELAGGPAEDLLDDNEAEGVNAPPFDAERVASLRKRLIDSLRHAANLKFLHEGAERVTVVVTGRSPSLNHAGIRVSGSSTVQANVVGYVKDLNGVQVVDLNGGRRMQQLTLTARKGDIDAFAAGRLSVEEFTRKVVVTTQPRLVTPKP